MFESVRDCSRVVKQYQDDDKRVSDQRCLSSLCTSPRLHPELDGRGRLEAQHHHACAGPAGNTGEKGGRGVLFSR